jgi:[ribosomal protein S5]-alanine N-acetyltransferase
VKRAAPRIESARLVCTIPSPRAAPRLSAYAIDNDRHLAPWEPPRPEGYFTEGYWRRRLEMNREEHAADQSLRLTILRRGDLEGPVVGHLNFNTVVRGAFQACTMGYSLDHRCVGQGFMTEAILAAIPFVFGTLKLHRIQANYIPTNERSGRVLRRAGFVVEGYARDYLFVGGAWRDHVLTSLTSPHPVAPA